MNYNYWRWKGRSIDVDNLIVIFEVQFLHGEVHQQGFKVLFLEHVVEELILFVLVVLRLCRLGEPFDFVLTDPHLMKDVLDGVYFLDALIVQVVHFSGLGTVYAFLHLDNVAALMSQVLPAFLPLLLPTPSVSVFIIWVDDF